ncbi:MAG: hypothetical protein ACQEVA_00520, partial [Myxococcota bacterium]
MAQELTLDDAIDAIDDLILDGDFDKAQQKLDATVAELGERDALAVLEAELLLESGEYKACVAKA